MMNRRSFLGLFGLVASSSVVVKGFLSGSPTTAKSGPLSVKDASGNRILTMDEMTKEILRSFEYNLAHPTNFKTGATRRPRNVI